LNEKGNQEEGGVKWIDLNGKYVTEKCRILCDSKKFFIEKGYEKYPVLYVSWFGSKAFCDWLSQKTGKNYRLPTEAQWEFTARGGIFSKKTKYAGGDNIGEVAWFSKNFNGKGARAVATSKANELGIYDMSGNVIEWCSDWNGDYEKYGKLITTDPKGAVSGSYRVFRGGSWSSDAKRCRVSDRYGGSPDIRGDDVGFRLASFPQ
jgi:formylglycine-generating enzyme